VGEPRVLARRARVRPAGARGAQPRAGRPALGRPEGGDLGWLAADDCAPEFAREIFGRIEIGVLGRLVHSRFGLHIVEVLEREPGAAQPFETVRGAVATSLRQQAFVTALRQYLRLLAGEAALEGVDLDAASTPLVQ
jgi:peptidyl-prolyl cis-trans isomerase C